MKTLNKIIGVYDVTKINFDVADLVEWCNRSLSYSLSYPTQLVLPLLVLVVLLLLPQSAVLLGSLLS